jgi:ATP-binding cassette subfamily G (WHITE) protein 2
MSAQCGFKNQVSDILLPFLTAALAVTAAATQALSDVGLLHVRDVIVGTPLSKGISGGERKRLCVALELITEPALLFL